MKSRGGESKLSSSCFNSNIMKGCSSQPWMMISRWSVPTINQEFPHNLEKSLRREREPCNILAVSNICEITATTYFESLHVIRYIYICIYYIVVVVVKSGMGWWVRASRHGKVFFRMTGVWQSKLLQVCEKVCSTEK